MMEYENPNAVNNAVNDISYINLPDKNMKEFSKIIVKVISISYIIIGIVLTIASIIYVFIAECADINILNNAFEYFKEPMTVVLLAYFSKSAFENVNKIKKGRQA